MQLQIDAWTQPQMNLNNLRQNFGQISVRDNVPVLTLNGRFDAHVAPAVKAWLAATGPVAIINLGAVHFIDSAALAVLVNGMKKCRQEAGDLVLCNLAQPVRIIFELTRFDKAFAIYADETTAVAALNRA